MGGEWREVTLAEISCDMSYGYTASAKVRRAGPRFLRITDIQGGTVDWKTVPFCEIPSSRIPTYLLQKGDIVVARTGSSTGENYLFNGDEETVFASYLVRFRISSSVADPRYVWYTLRSPAWWHFIQGAKTGSAQAGTNAKVLGMFKLPLPPLPEQRAIAHILGTLDDKIELNRRMNETLEAMAQALFKSWFVDFDPVVVNALKAGNPIPDKFAKRAAWYGRTAVRPDDALGLPEHILRLFPDRFVDSELGPIPKGWEVKPIGDLVKCVGGATPSTKNPEYWEGGTNPFLTPRDMASLDAPVVLDTERHITDAGVDRISSKKLPVGTVLLSSRAPIGYLAINEVPVSINQGIIAMICDSEIPNYYAFFWVKNNMDVIKGKAGGTTFAEISKKNFRPIPALRPSDEILNRFVNMAESFYKQIVENAVSSVTLVKLRDTLLPKLISGELRVPDVKKILEYW